MIHWHCHGDYSHVASLDGLGTAEHYAPRAAELGQPALARTDHATLGGVLHHIEACRKNSVIPIVGCEVYFRPNRFHEKDEGVESAKANHLCLHAASHKGWKNLLAITSKAWTTGGKNGLGFYGKPVCDWSLLEEHSEGLICTTACVFSPVVSPLVFDGNDDLARSNFKRLQSIFKDRLWAEIMPHAWDKQKAMNLWVVNVAAELGVGVMVTVDAHTPFKGWKRAHEVFQMHATHQTIASNEKKKEGGEEVYGSTLDSIFLMSDAEVRQYFAQNHPYMPEHVVSEGIANTHEALKQMRLWTVDRDEKFPRVDGDAVEILRQWSREGMERIGKAGDEEYEKRFEFEFNVLVKNKVVPYFVIVGDLVRWARSDAPLPATPDDPHPEKKKPIRVGLGRGSAAGCLISYLVGITSIDPIPYGLLFERFLNPDRVGMPDIDLDFSSKGREMVKEYLRRKYGYDHVADVVAHQYFAPRELITDLGRVFGIPQPECEKVKKSMKPTDRGWEKQKKANPALKEFADKYPDLDAVATIWDGQVHRRSKHAAAIVITPDPVLEHIPLELQKPKQGQGGRGTIITGWSNRADFEIIADFGFLKLDVLGVEDLDRQDYAMEEIRARESRNPFIKQGRPDPLDLEILHNPDAADPLVLKMFGEGATVGVFQFHTGGMTQLLRQIKPDRIEDLIAANALYRPGAMSMAYEYAKRKHGEVPESEWYWHPSVKPFMEQTYGVLCYQEQVMQIVKALGDFTGGQADGMRKGISKWYRLGKDECIRKLREAGFEEQWYKGTPNHGITRADADRIWNNILDFAGYGFNKSHSASYALQAYQGMHLKVHDALEEYSSLLSLPDDEDDFVPRVIREMKTAADIHADIAVPDINESKMGFTPSRDKLLFGLLSVKGVGDKVVYDILDEREANGPFQSYGDYCRRLPGHAGGAGMALIKAGAFDSLDGRDFLLSTVRKGISPKIIVRFSCGEEVQANSKKKADELQCPTHGVACAEASRRDHWDTYTVAEHINHNRKLKTPRPLPDERDLPSGRFLKDAEKDMLGVLVSYESSIVKYADLVDDFSDSEERFENMPDNAEVQVVGEIVKVKPHKTKKGQPMAFLDLANGPDHFSCTLFTAEWLRFSDVLDEADSVIVQGRKNTYNSRSGIIVDRLQDLEDFAIQMQED